MSKKYKILGEQNGITIATANVSMNRSGEAVKELLNDLNICRWCKKKIKGEYEEFTISPFSSEMEIRVYHPECSKNDQEVQPARVSL